MINLLPDVWLVSIVPVLASFSLVSSWGRQHRGCDLNPVKNLEGVTRRCIAQFWGAGLTADKTLYFNCSSPCSVSFPKN